MFLVIEQVGEQVTALVWAGLSKALCMSCLMGHMRGHTMRFSNPVSMYFANIFVAFQYSF